MENKMVIVAGHFGSGKTEFAINLSLKLSQTGKKVNLIDLDFVNPYFRSRRFREELLNSGVYIGEPADRAISVADIPSISSGLLSKISDKEKDAVIEVGGDPVGSRVLGSLETQIKSRKYEFYAIFNCYRPDTDSPEKVKEMVEKIEFAAKLKVSALVSNCHLKELTDEESLKYGLEFTQKLEKNYLPVKYFCIDKELEIPEFIKNSSYDIFTIEKFNTYCYERGKHSRIQI